MSTSPQQPQQPFPNQPPAYNQPPPYPPPKRRIWPWVLLGVFALFGLLFAGCVALVANEVAEDTKSQSRTESAGSEVRDGQFAFVVTAVDPPVPVVGTGEFWQQTAQGEYLLVHVTIHNVGNEPRNFSGVNQKLLDEQGREYTNDTMAELNLNKNLSADINPGNKVEAVLVFDVPKGSVPTVIEFHDSMFSGGTRVALK
ncbi:DUF4352 domain-containing protein [Nocardia sp. NPDC051832]|uniref:DUF4352 domain-containing protein n=1 Tax=Nocardia sp. NPDC051832 TaxID=3155673 RepID=UPI003417FB64